MASFWMIFLHSRWLFTVTRSRPVAVSCEGFKKSCGTKTLLEISVTSILCRLYYKKDQNVIYTCFFLATAMLKDKNWCHWVMNIFKVRIVLLWLISKLLHRMNTVTTWILYLLWESCDLSLRWELQTVHWYRKE